MQELTTQQFLSYFPGSVFRILTETGREGRVAKDFKSYDEKLFHNFNDNHLCAVYFSVNEFNDKAAKPNLKKLVACFNDCDVRKQGEEMSVEDLEDRKNALLENALTLDIRPNIYTKTKNGLQFFWFIDEAGIDEETQARFVNANEGIIDFFKALGSKGDDVKDVARILRLPGFKHQKEEPYLIKSYFVHDVKTSLDELEKLFPHERKPKYLPPSPEDQKYESDWMEELKGITMQDIAIRALSAYGEPGAYFDERGRIVISRGTTGAFLSKDKNPGEFIASTSHEIPGGGKIKFVQNLLGLPSYKDAMDWLRKEYNLQVKPQPKADKKLDSTVKAQSASWISTEELLNESVAELKATDHKKVIQYGYSFLDDQLGGIFPGEIVLVGAISGTGKSTFVTRLARNISYRHKIGFVALEDRLQDFMLKNLYFEIGTLRKMARCLNYPWIDFRKNHIEDPKFWGYVESAKQKIVKGNIDFLKQTDPLDTNYLTTAIEKKYREDGTKIFVLDHLHMLTFGDFGQSKERQIEESMKALVHLKDKLGISLIIVAHLRKLKEDQLPSMTDFKDAMAIAQMSNTVVLMWRDKSSAENQNEYDKRVTKFIVPKARMGLTEFTAETLFSKETGDYAGLTATPGTDSAQEENGGFF